MTDQVTPEGGALPSDAPASQVEQQTEVTTAKPGSEADPSPAAPESEKPAKPTKTGEQIRIDELTRRLREAERRNDRLLRVYEERETAPAPQPQAPVAKPKTLEDFNFDQGAYLKHVATETATSAAAAVRAELAKAREQEEAAERRAGFDAKAEAFAKTVEDYEEVISGKWPCSVPMAEVIESSDEGPSLAYYLAQNPDEASKLAKLSPAQAGRELARLEDRIVNERKKAAQKPVSQAPPPAPKIEGSGAAGVVGKPDTPDSDQLSDAEWTRRRNSQEQARRRKQREG